MLGSAIAAVGLGFAQVATVPLLACLGGLLLAPVAAGFAVWVLGGSKGVTE
jgi:hypothetical protein